MAWGKNGTPSTLGGTASTIEITDLTSTKFNTFLAHLLTDGSAVNQHLRVNDASGSVYADRQSINGGTDNVDVNRSQLTCAPTNGATDTFIICYALNISGEERLFLFYVAEQGASGASTAPARTEGAGKYVTDTNITEVSFTETLAGSYAASSNISALGSDLTPAAAVPFAENVQVGSRAEITDTRKIYHYEDPLTFEDDFSGTDDWTDSNSTYAGVNTTTDVLDFNVAASTTFDEASVYDLTSVSDTSWVLHCKLDVTTYTAISSGGTQTWAFGISSADQTEGQDGTNDFLGIRARITGSGLNQWELNDADGEGIGAVENADFTRGLSVETVYLELIRSGSTLTGRFWADSAHTVLLEQNILTIVGTVSSLRYLKVMAASVPGTGNGVFQGTVDEVKFWNGVTSAGNAWSEEGT